MTGGDADQARSDGTIRSLVFVAVACLPLGVGIASLHSMPLPPEVKALVSALGGALAFYLRMRATGWWPTGRRPTPSAPETADRQPGSVSRTRA